MHVAVILPEPIKSNYEIFEECNLKRFDDGNFRFPGINKL